MEYGKLINNQLLYAPTTLIIDGREMTAELFTSTQYLQNGYKEVIRTPEPDVEWYEKCCVSYGENDKQIVEEWLIVPQDNLKDLYTEKSNNKCDYTIAFGFTFFGNDNKIHSVRATLTDQWNYSNSKEPFPCEIKIGEDDYYQFNNQEELDDFRAKLEAHIVYVLKIVCWGEKKAIIGMTNQEIYEYLQISNPF